MKTPSMVNELPAVIQPPEGVPAVQEGVGELLAHGNPRPPAIVPEQTVKNIAGAIAAVMTKIGIITKRGENQFHHYKYASMQDILQKLTPLLAKHGLVIMQNEISRSMFDSDRTIAIQYAFTIFHTSGEVWPERPVQTGMSRCRDSRGGFDDKSINKCHTAARKYFLLALFQIATGDEDDADNEKPPSRPIQRQAPIPHDATTGEILDDEIPEWHSPQPATEAAADRAGAPRRSEPHSGASAETTEQRLVRLDNELQVAAENGTEDLRRVWKTIAPADQKTLEPVLRNHYQKRAADIDEAVRTL